MVLRRQPRSRAAASRVAAALAFALTFSAAGWSAERAGPLQVSGQLGLLGEWEMSGELAPSARDEFAGTVKLAHVGICTQDGPETRSGEIRLRLAGASQVRATVVLDGVTCDYRGKKDDAFKGVLNCPDRRGVPLMLWLK